MGMVSDEDYEHGDDLCDGDAEDDVIGKGQCVMDIPSIINLRDYLNNYVAKFSFPSEQARLNTQHPKQAFHLKRQSMRHCEVSA